MPHVRRLRHVERRHSDRRSYRPRRDGSPLSDTLLLRLRLPVLVAVRGAALANVLAIPTSALDPRGLRDRANGRDDTLQHARSSVRFGRQSALLVLRVESIHGPTRGIQILTDTDLRREPVRHVAKHRSSAISHAD